MKRKASRPTSSISKANSYEELGRYWDTHELANAEPADFSVDIRRRRFLVAIEPKLFAKIRRQATKKGLSAEGLVNLWARETWAASR